MMKKAKRVLSYAISGMAILYAGALLFPQIIFSNAIEYKNFKVYQHLGSMNDQKLESILDESIVLLSASDVYDDKKKHKIFLCNSFSEFAFFATRARKSFAINYPVIQNIFLSQSNILENSIKRNGSENNVRTLSGIIAHETTHSLLEDKLGFLKYKLLPSWKNEGYCDYVAQESSYDEKLGWDQICENNKEEVSSSYIYFKYRTYVEYLLNEEKTTISDFLAEDFDLERLAFRSRKERCLEL